MQSLNRKGIEILAFEGCPHLDAAIERAREAVAHLGAAVDVRIVLIEDEAQAKELRFVGSPTIRVGGVDVEPSAAQREDYAMQCRVYSVDGHLEGAPPVEWIEAALRETD